MLVGPSCSFSDFSDFSDEIQVGPVVVIHDPELGGKDVSSELEALDGIAFLSLTLS
jgi:hypothetical protein